MTLSFNVIGDGCAQVSEAKAETIHIDVYLFDEVIDPGDKVTLS